MNTGRVVTPLFLLENEYHLGRLQIGNPYFFLAFKNLQLNYNSPIRFSFLQKQAKRIVGCKYLQRIKQKFMLLDTGGGGVLEVHPQRKMPISLQMPKSEV